MMGVSFPDWATENPFQSSNRKETGLTFPDFPNPSLSPDLLYTVKPGLSDLGYGQTNETKARLKETLLVGLDRLVSYIRPGPNIIRPEEREPRLVVEAAQSRINMQRVLLYAAIAVGAFFLIRRRGI